MPILLLAAIIIIVDQWSKYYVQSHLVLGASIPIIPEIFHLTYILNPGAAFGLLEHQRAFFVGVAIVMLAGVGYFYRHIPPGQKMLRVGLGLLAGGAVGNLIDRIQTGLVVDFFDFRIWPVFNIADIAIVTGVGCIIYTLIFRAEKEDDKLG